MSLRSIATLVKANVKTVVKWKLRNTAFDLPRTGAPSVLTADIKASITTMCRDQWNASTRSVTKILNQPDSRFDQKMVSRSTVQRYIQSTDWGRVAYKAQVRPLLTQKNVHDRFAFCEKLMQEGYCRDSQLGRKKRAHILFTDESVIELFPRPNLQNTRIRTSTPELRVPIQIPKYGLKIMVAGGMSAYGLTQLHIVDPDATVTGEYYRTRILPLYSEAAKRTASIGDLTRDRMFSTSNMVVLMQDGAPAHTANATLSLISTLFPRAWSRGIWPGNSPDLNPIEHLWPILQDSVFIEPRPRNRDELVQRVQEAWINISRELLQRLISSIPGRILTCYANGGGRSGY